MLMSFLSHSRATERSSLERVLETLPRKIKHTEAKLERWKEIGRLTAESKILDVGAAAGTFVVGCIQAGYDCVGVEPTDEARENARMLEERLGISIPIVEGYAEQLPFGDESFDIVHAQSVIEHVQDLDKAFAEIYRVLKPNGLFWFNAASAMCPWQPEISGFPLFGWYPHWLKLKIMYWARDHKPELVGFTEYPAVNWFTNGRARRLLYSHGFRDVYDRWDLRRREEGSKLYGSLLELIRSTETTKRLADTVITGCSYAAVK